jgi:predicted nucleic acid-binding protein
MSGLVVVADTSVLINFLRIQRMDLIGRHACRFLATNHVEQEISEHYGEQHAAYAAALATGQIHTCAVIDPDEVQLYLKLSQGRRLGSGECSAIAVAMRRNYAVAMDDNRAVNRALREADLAGVKLDIIRTQDIMVELIQSGVLTVTEADTIKENWARFHRFRMKFGSFGDLL